MDGLFYGSYFIPTRHLKYKMAVIISHFYIAYALGVTKRRFLSEFLKIISVIFRSLLEIRELA
jgi:hypothetical protein